MGNNDFFQLKGMENITILNTKVYKSYGIEIFDFENPDINWSQIDQVSGLDYYILRYEDFVGKQFYNKVAGVEVRLLFVKTF